VTLFPCSCKPTAASTMSLSAPPIPRSGWKKTIFFCGRCEERPAASRVVMKKATLVVGGVWPDWLPAPHVKSDGSHLVAGRPSVRHSRIFWAGDTKPMMERQARNLQILFLHTGADSSLSRHGRDWQRPLCGRPKLQRGLPEWRHGSRMDPPDLGPWQNVQIVR
jgi:hypothetical protein